MDAQARSALSSPLLLRLLIFPDAVSLLQRRPLSSLAPPVAMAPFPPPLLPQASSSPSSSSHGALSQLGPSGAAPPNAPWRSAPCPWMQQQQPPLFPPQNSSPGSPSHRVLRSICAVPTHVVVLVFGTAPCRVIALRSSTVYEPHFAGSAQPQHRRRSPSVRRRQSLLIPHRLCSPVINCVYVLFLFCLWRRETPCLGEGKSFNARRMFGAMHKSESPSSLQTPIGFVYGEPMHVALDRLD